MDAHTSPSISLMACANQRAQLRCCDALRRVYCVELLIYALGVLQDAQLLCILLCDGILRLYLPHDGMAFSMTRLPCCRAILSWS